MIGLAYLDLALLAAAALSCFGRLPSKLVFHDPISAAIASIGTALSSAAAAAPEAAAALGTGAAAGADLAAIPALTLPDVAVTAAAPALAAAAPEAAAAAIAPEALSAALGTGAALLPEIAGAGTVSSAIPSIGATLPTTATPSLPTVSTGTPISPAPSLPTSMAPPGQTAAPGVGASGTAAPSSVALDPLASGSSTQVTDAFPASVNATPGSQLASATPTGTSATSGVDATGAAGGGTPPVATTSPGDVTIGGDASTMPGDFGGGPSGPDSSGFFGGGAGSTIKDVGSWLLKNPGLAIGGAGLGLEALMQPKMPSIQSSLGPLESQAANLNTQGQALQQYLQTGTLPAGIQAGIDQATAAAKATIKSKYAAMGGGAETSSAAIEDMANVDMTAQTQGANIALQLLQQGVSESQMSSQLYQALLSQTLSSDQALSNAIGNFAAAAVPKTVLATNVASTPAAA